MVIQTALLMAQTSVPSLNGQKWAFCGFGNQVDTTGMVGLERWQGHFLFFNQENVTCSDKNDSLVHRNGIVTEYFGQYALISDTLSMWFSQTAKSNPAGKVVTAGPALEPDGYTTPFKTKFKIVEINETTMSVRVLLSLPIPYKRPTPMIDAVVGMSAMPQEPVMITYYRIN